MPDQYLQALINSGLTVIITVVLIVCIKKFGDIPMGSTGVELNLLTYGALWEVINAAMNKKEYWSNMATVNPELDPYKNHLLAFAVFLNVVMMGANFKLAHTIEKSTSISLSRKRLLQFISLCLGLISLMFYVVFKVFWEK